MIPSEVLTCERATKVKPLESSFFGNGTMSRFVYLMHQVSSTTTPDVEFSHSQAIYTSNSTIPLCTKYKKAEKCEMRIIIQQNAHLSGKGTGYIF
jgi:hypothetical protein